MGQEEERGGLITQLREQRLWTREKLAKEAGVSPTTVAQAEEGRTHVRLATIGKLATALEVDPQELLHPKKAQAPSSPAEASDEGRREESVYDLVREAVTRQLDEARKANNRAHESDRPQVRFVHHENEVLQQLLERHPSEVADAYISLMEGVLQLERENARLRAEKTPIPQEQLEAFQAENERENERIREELAKMSKADLLEMMMKNPASRRLSEAYRKNEEERAKNRTGSNTA